MRYKVFVADDDEDDFLTLKEAFNIFDIELDLIHFLNGRELLDHLQRLKQSLEYPQLIILDVNMPKLDGLSTLALIKNKSEFSAIPVLMHSTSSNAGQINKCISLGAQAFASKLNSFKLVVSFVGEICLFLQKGCALPGVSHLSGTSGTHSTEICNIK